MADDAEQPTKVSNASETGSPSPQPETNPAIVSKKRKRPKKAVKSTLSFAQDDDEDEANEVKRPSKSTATDSADSRAESKSPGPSSSAPPPQKRLGPNSKLAHSFVPSVRTAAAQKREKEAREKLQQDFLARQEAVKEAVIAIPFVFYDGTSVPGGICRVRKGDQVWLFLDKARKVGAERDVGGGERERAKALREWARVGVDDLLIVRGEIIIPHHYEFYYFIVNKNLGPKGIRLFDYSAEPPSDFDPNAPIEEAPAKAIITNKAERKREKEREVLLELDAEGIDSDPNFTKVVDRRWYERNKHIFPVSTWEEFDPAKDYQNIVRRDAGGNAFFF